MKIPSGVTDQYIYFVAVDSTDLKTRETGLSSFTVYRSRDGAAAAAMTTPTVNETDSSNMPGVYELLLDEDMTIGSGNDSEEMAFHITQASMAPVTRTVELYRPKITAGYTLGVESDGDLTQVNSLAGHTAQTADHTAGIADVPTVAEFNARTQPTADYFDPAADTVANVTLTATTTDVTNQVTADVTAISGDSTAADNLELQYDTTGLSGDTFPATQAAVANIGAASGGAVNIEATEDNTGGAIIDSVTFVGSVTSGTYADTNISGGSHAMNDTVDVIDIVYGFDVTGGRVATGVTILANLNGNADEIVVKAYDHVGSAWNEVELLSGSGGGTYTALTPSLLTKHTGTGVELGKVYIRFDTDSTTPASLDVKLLLVSAVSTSTSVGYAGGQYWVSSTGTAGSEIGTNGTADNPCPWANALVMNATQPLNRFQIANGNTVTLSANSDGYTLTGDNWNLALGGQSIEGLAVTGTVTVTGIGTATTTPPTFIGCNFGAVTLPPGEMRDCGYGHSSGVFTAGSDGQYLIINGFSEVPGSGSPSLVFSGLGATTGINNRGWRGGSTYTLDSDCTLSHEVLAGGGTTITTGGGDVEVRGIPRSLTVTVSASEKVQFVGIVGPITITDNASVAPEINLYGVCSTLTDGTGSANDYTVSNSSVNAEVDTALSDYDGPTNAEMIARTLASASYFDPAADTVATVTTVTNQVTADVTAVSGDSTAADNLELDYDGTGYNKSNSTIGTTTTNTDMVGTDGANTVVPMTAALSQTEHDATQAAVSGLNDPTAATVADAVWDEILTGATYNTPTSAGRRLRELAGTIIISGTAATGTSNTITLDGDASTSDGAYDPAMVYIVAGTGLGQTRNILDYVGSTKIATVDRNWRTNPDATSEYIIGASAGREHVNEGLAQAGTSSTITLNASASASDDAYINQTVFIRSGTGEDQARIVTDYNGTTKVATLGDNWAVTPDTTSGYVMLPTHVYEVETIAETVRTEMDSNSTQLAAIVADTNELQTNQGNWLTATGFATAAALTTHDGKLDTVDTNVDSILVDTGTTLPASIATVDTNVDSILTDTGTTLPAQITALNDFDPTSDEVDLGKIKGTAVTETNAGDVAESFSFFYDVDPVTTKTVDDVGVAGSGLTQQNVRDAMKLAPTAGAPAAASVDEHLDDILADTNELQSDDVPGLISTHDAKLDTVDGIVDTILVDTNDLQTNQGNWLTATGFATAAALTTHDGKLDTVDGIVDSILVDTGTTLPAQITSEINDVQSDISSLNDLSAAQVNAEVDTALSDYDGPTNTEMLAAHSTTDALITTVDGVVDAILVDTGTTLPASIATIDTNVDAILVDTGTVGVVISTATAQAIADEILKRGVSNVEGTADKHSLTSIVLASLESSLSGTTWTIKQTDGSTTFTTKTVTVDASADPITAVT
ncbi:MAG: hypothetical protein GY938_27155 [Ketobacter sp.]|nr:hypothetical protein [Ketobacter sp.]